METWGLFLAKSLLASGLLICGYFLVLRNRRFHQFNRFFLLLIYPASLVIPCLHFNFFRVPPLFRQHLSAISVFSSKPTDAAVHLVKQQASNPHSFNWSLLLLIIVLLISGVLLAVLCYRIGSVYRMRRQYPLTKYAGYDLVWTDAPKTPFAFLHTIFWNKSIALDAEIGQIIFRHELTHIRQRHTYDKLFSQIWSSVIWFNPFYWLIQKELQVVHEFLADEQSLDHRDTDTFARMILQSYGNLRWGLPEHPFFSSPIKRRIAMVQKGKLGKDALWRPLAILPLVVGIVFLCSFSTEPQRYATGRPSKENIVVFLDMGSSINASVPASYQRVSDPIGQQLAERLRSLAKAYHITIVFHQMQENGRTIAPDLSIGLQVSGTPGQNAARGNFDVYVSGESEYAPESNAYSSIILDQMAIQGLIPGHKKTCGHVGVPCKCRVPAQNLSRQMSGSLQEVNEQQKMVAWLLKAKNPAMVLSVANTTGADGQKWLNNERKVEAWCHAVLSGIVEGRAVEAQVKRSSAPLPHSSSHPWVYTAPASESCSIK